MDIQKLFKMGMKRDIPPLIEPDMSYAFNLGCGNTLIDGATNLDLPDWDATEGMIPCRPGMATAIFAFHFFEHLTGEQAIQMLREVQRVLRPEGTLNVVVPYYASQLAFQDLDHKSFWTLETWRTLMDNHMYDKHRHEPWMFDIHANFVMGIVDRNMAIMSQLVRV